MFRIVAPPERVDGLVGVTDDRQLARDQLPTGRPHQLAHQDVLRMVGVLVLVDQHLAEPAPVVLGHSGEGLQQVDRRHDQVVEVQRVRLPQPRLVAGVDRRQHLVEAVRRARRRPRRPRVGLRVDELVLEGGDPPRERLCRELLRVKVQLAGHQGEQPLGVGGVVDRERRPQAEGGRLTPQDPHAGGVERGDPHGPRRRADQRRDPLAHLPGRLVGERDGQHLTGPHLPGGQLVRDPVGQHPGLAGPGSRDDQQR